MILNKDYTSKTGAVRTPINISDCMRFILVVCKYSNGDVKTKWFWSCHRLFKD